VTPSIAVVLVVALAFGYWLWHRRQNRVTAIDPNSPEWQAATERARATLPLLRELLPLHPDQSLVKVAVANRKGSQEHVWAQLQELGPDALRATLVTPLLEPAPGQPQLLTLPLVAIEDWRVLLPDGRIRGSFTTRAQIEVCRATGQRVPRHLRDIESRLVDV
jgi:hypothetical protein